MTGNQAPVLTASAADTQRLGEQLGRLLEPGDVVLLHGDLGAGKTTLTQGILRGLNASSPAQSPTFMLVSEHAGHVLDGRRVVVRHIDLYRLNEPGEVDSIGYADLLDDPAGITIVEWPERAANNLPARYLLVTIDFGGPDHRSFTITSNPPDDRFKNFPRQ